MQSGGSLSPSGSRHVDRESSRDVVMEDDWSHVEDPNERRKIQNRIAQRKFREYLSSIMVWRVLIMSQERRFANKEKKQKGDTRTNSVRQAHTVRQRQKMSTTTKRQVYRGAVSPCDT